MIDANTFQALNKNGFLISNQSIDTSIIKKIETVIDYYFKNNPTVDQYAIRRLF